MCLSYKKPAKCLNELHSPALQEANTHRLFIKPCLLMDKHAVSADRVVNIDETSCRLLPVHQIGCGRRVIKQAQLQGNTEEATTFTVAFSLDHGPLDMLIEQAVKTDAVLPEEAHSPRHAGERLGHHGDHDPAVHSHIGQRAEPEQRTTSVDPSLGHGQHPRQRGHDDRHEGEVHVVLCFLPPRSTSYLQPLRRGRLPQLQEPEPVDWAMEKVSDDEDDAPMPDLIDMPPAPASAPRMSNLERCIALRLVYGSGPR